MRRETAERLADLILGLAAAGVFYVVLRTPHLRRLAWELARTVVTVSLPAYLSREIGEAWAESTTSRRSPAPPARARLANAGVGQAARTRQT